MAEHTDTASAENQAPANDRALADLALRLRRLSVDAPQMTVEGLAQQVTILACMVEDYLAADVRPDHCGHPRWGFRNGKEVCRSCGADVSHMDPMGAG